MACCACPICFCFPCELEGLVQSRRLIETVWSHTREREREGEISQSNTVHDQRHTCNLPAFSHSKEISHGCGCGWTTWQAATWPTGHKNTRRHAMSYSNQYLLLPSLLNAKLTHAHMGCMLRHFVTWTIFHGPMGHGTCVLAEVLDWCWVLWSHPLQPRRHWCRGDPKQVRVKLMVKHGESNKTSWQQLKHIKTGSNIVVKSFIGCTLTPFFDQRIAVSLKAWFATHESLAFYVPPVVSDMDVFGVIYVSVHIMEGIILHHAPCQQGSCEWVRKKR